MAEIGQVDLALAYLKLVRAADLNKEEQENLVYALVVACKAVYNDEDTKQSDLSADQVDFLRPCIKQPSYLGQLKEDMSDEVRKVWSRLEKFVEGEERR
jgi:hypothetical protein